MHKHFVVLLISLLVVACGKPVQDWSPVTKSKDGNYKVTGTLGLSLSLGSSGIVQFTLGPSGSRWAPAGTEAEKDLLLFGLSVGTWTLEKGSTKVILPRGSNGYVQANEVYENFAPEVWGVLSSPGCSTLSTFTETIGGASSTIVQRTYRLCDVEKAVQALRR